MDFEQLLSYDQWANQKVFEAFQNLKEGEMRNEVEGLFSHILAAQQVWLSRINFEKAQVEIWPALTAQEMERLMNENKEQLNELVPRKEEIISYKNSKGQEFENKVEEVLMHLIIHGQHHRAQIAKLLREAGVNPPGTDFIFFLRTVHN